jgi:hypothetical protein
MTKIADVFSVLVNNDGAIELRRLPLNHGHAPLFEMKSEFKVSGMNMRY